MQPAARGLRTGPLCPTEAGFEVRAAVRGLCTAASELNEVKRAGKLDLVKTRNSGQSQVKIWCGLLTKLNSCPLHSPDYYGSVRKLPWVMVNPRHKDILEVRYFRVTSWQAWIWVTGGKPPLDLNLSLINSFVAGGWAALSEILVPHEHQRRPPAEMSHQGCRRAVAVDV